MMGLVDHWVYAKKVNNYIVDATDTAAGNLKYDSDQVATMTVPGSKRWKLLPSIVSRDVSSTCEIAMYNAADKQLARFASMAAATGVAEWPEQTYNIVSEIILDAGEYIKFSFGTAQTGAAFLSCVVLELAV